jgi:hypothetical protein
MVYRGTVHGGLVILERGAALPDGMDVIVEPLCTAVPDTVPTAWVPSLRNGVPVFPSRGNGTAANLDLVNKLRDEAS